MATEGCATRRLRVGREATSLYSCVANHICCCLRLQITPEIIRTMPFIDLKIWWRRPSDLFWPKSDDLGRRISTSIFSRSDIAYSGRISRCFYFWDRKIQIRSSKSNRKGNNLIIGPILSKTFFFQNFQNFQEKKNHGPYSFHLPILTELVFQIPFFSFMFLLLLKNVTYRDRTLRTFVQISKFSQNFQTLETLGKKLSDNNDTHTRKMFRTFFLYLMHRFFRWVSA